MRLFISGPMRGRRDFNKAEFSSASQHLRYLGYEVADPHALDAMNGFDWTGFEGRLEELEQVGFDLAAAMVRNLRTICDWAEGIVLLPHWSASWGVRVELAAANACGRKIFEYRHSKNLPWSIAPDPLVEITCETKVDVSDIRRVTCRTNL